MVIVACLCPETDFSPKVGNEILNCSEPERKEKSWLQQLQTTKTRAGGMRCIFRRALAKATKFFKEMRARVRGRVCVSVCLFLSLSVCVKECVNEHVCLCKGETASSALGQRPCQGQETRGSFV